jgi:hypothetical protein
VHVSCGFAVNFRDWQIFLGAVQKRVDEAKNHASDASRPYAAHNDSNKVRGDEWVRGSRWFTGKRRQRKASEERGQERGGILQGRDTKNDEEAEKSTDTSEADLNVKDDEKQPVFVPAACRGKGKGVWGMHRTFKCKKSTSYRHTQRTRWPAGQGEKDCSRRYLHSAYAGSAYWTAAAGHH